MVYFIMVPIYLIFNVLTLLVWYSHFVSNYYYSYSYFYPHNISSQLTCDDTVKSEQQRISYWTNNVEENFLPGL